MTDKLFLKQAIQKSGYREAYLAAQLNLSTETFTKKLNNKLEFRASEMEKLSVLLSFTAEQRTKAFFG